MKKQLVTTILLILTIGTTWYAVNSFLERKEHSKGLVKIDGSSSVFRISEAIAEKFQQQHPDIKVAVAISGTDGGFQKLLQQETHINNTSRTITPIEDKIAQQSQMSYIELPIAYDSISIVVNKKNEFVTSLTTKELKKIWQPNSTVITWQDVRPHWPNDKINLYSPRPGSDTFNYFTEVIVGKKNAIRSKFTTNENDDVLLQSVTGDANALGYFSYTDYAKNKDNLNVIQVDSGYGPVTPSPVTIKNGSYIPLSRPVFIYMSMQALNTPHINKFVQFYIDNITKVISDIGYTALTAQEYNLVKKRLTNRIAGSAYPNHSSLGFSLQQILMASPQTLELL